MILPLESCSLWCGINGYPRSSKMASSGDGEQVRYLYTPDLEDELYEQNLMLTHPTNILKLDEAPDETQNADECCDMDAETGAVTTASYANRQDEEQVVTSSPRSTVNVKNTVVSYNGSM